MIHGVKVKKLRVIPDERGYLMEMLRCDDEMFTKFGQVYVTVTYPGVIKAWHYHTYQSDNIVAVKGMLKLVLYDPREDSPTQGEINEFFLGEHNPMLVHVPNSVYHGWKGIATEPAMVVNTVTEPYNYENPDEHRLPYDTDRIPYNWDITMG
jgi:dTDP-4-dehydrorhamnose 3,5-epimerase